MLGYLLEYNRYCNLIGIVVVLTIAWLFSHNRRAINYRMLLTALLVEVVIGLAVLKTKIGHSLVNQVSLGVFKLYQCADAGTSFVFGSLVDKNSPWGFIFAFQVLPIIVFFGSFMSLLFYFGIIQRVVYVVSRLIRPLLGTSGPETVCAVANSFLGQTEAPLLIRHYLAHMTRSELFVVMVSGMATISSAILTAYAMMGVPVFHLLASAVMSIPASIAIAKIILPETEPHADVDMLVEDPSVHKPVNMFDAISGGTCDGLHLALNVGAMLVSFLALIALVNALLAGLSMIINTGFGCVGSHHCIPTFTIQAIFAYCFAPVGYLLGLTGNEALQAGELIGTKIAINEFIAYTQLIKTSLSERAIALLTYALCGFSNLSCIGIQIGGIGALVPSKRHVITELGLYAVLGGSLANILTAMIAGLLL